MSCFKYTIYLFLTFICVWWGFQIKSNLYTFSDEGFPDLAIYLNQFELWKGLDFTSHNSVRGAYTFSDHLDPSIMILTPFYALGGISALIFLIPFLVIFLPVFILDKTFKFSALQVFVFGAFLAFHPLTQNSLLFGVLHSNSLAPLAVALVVWSFLKKSKLFFPFYIFAIFVKEDMPLFINLLLVQLAFWDYLQNKNFKQILKYGLGCFAISLAWLFIFLNRDVAVSYDHANSFSTELTDERKFVLTHYLIFDFPSFLVGNLAGIVLFFYRFFSDYLVNPQFHHGVLQPILSIASIGLFLNYFYGNSKTS